MSRTSVVCGPVQVGSTAPNQTVTVTNIGASAVVMSGAGGGVSSPFSGFQGCQGKTLHPGASCQLVYSFTPTAPGPAIKPSAMVWIIMTFKTPLTTNPLLLAPLILTFTPPLPQT